MGYDYNDEIKPLSVRFPLIIGYAKFFDNAKTISSKVNDKNC